ncbi:hypothetical protein [Tsukamurella pseudospumae]|nr:hypothetical protein [Tsukamurella pseudospumae]
MDTGLPAPPHRRRSATWIIYMGVITHFTFACAITWMWCGSTSNRAITTVVLIGTFATASAGCVSLAIGTGCRRGGRPIFYAKNQDRTWVPYVSLLTPGRVAAGPLFGAVLLTPLIALLFSRHGGPTQLEIVAFVVYSIVANGAMWLSYRSVRDYHRGVALETR